MQKASLSKKLGAKMRERTIAGTEQYTLKECAPKVQSIITKDCGMTSQKDCGTIGSKRTSLSMFTFEKQEHPEKILKSSQSETLKKSGDSIAQTDCTKHSEEKQETAVPGTDLKEITRILERSQETESNSIKTKDVIENDNDQTVSHLDDASDAGSDKEENWEHFENSVGKTFLLNLTDEVKEEVEKLYSQCQSGKPPTSATFKVFTAATLEVLLRYNDRPAAGMDKNQMAALVADYMKNGVPPRCPKCTRGALRFSNGKKRYGKRYFWCPGYYSSHWYACSFKADREEIQRIPWKCPP